MRKIANLCAVALCLVALHSCVTSRDLSYLVDMVPDTPYDVTPKENIKLQQGDRLTITVFSDDAELTAPFNLTSGGSLEDAESKSTTLNYIVDNQGNVDFPVIGLVPAEGKTIKELEDEIQRKIKNSGYIKNPKINVNLDNFIITILGSAGNSVLTMDREDVNILQVVAMAGGTDYNTRIKDVAVIRTENGKRTMYEVDLQSKDLFDSPVYYIQQNDVIYFRPKGGYMSRLASTGMSMFSMGMSVISVVASIFVLANAND